MMNAFLTFLTISVVSNLITLSIFEIKIMPQWYYQLKRKPFNCETCTTFWSAIVLTCAIDAVAQISFWYAIKCIFFGIAATGLYPLSWVAFWLIQKK